MTKKGTQSGGANICLKENDKFVFDPAAISNIFKSFFSDIAEKLLAKLPTASNRFNKNSVSEFYKKFNIKNKFQFSHVTDETILEILQALKNLDVTKATGIDNIAAIFL